VRESQEGADFALKNFGFGDTNSRYRYVLFDADKGISEGRTEQGAVLRGRKVDKGKFES